jgi:hypothetical protein
MIQSEKLFSKLSSYCEFLLYINIFSATGNKQTITIIVIQNI